MEVRICLGRAKASQETLSLHERDRCTEGDETVDRDDDTGAVAYTIQAKYICVFNAFCSRLWRPQN